MKYVSVCTIFIAQAIFFLSPFAYAMKEEIVQEKPKIELQELSQEEEEKRIYEKIIQKHHHAYEQWLNTCNEQAQQKFNPSQSFKYILTSTLQDLAKRVTEYQPLLNAEYSLNQTEDEKYERKCPLLQMQLNHKRTVLDDIIVTALWLDLIIQKNDHTGPILFLGRSPGHVKTAYEELLAYRTNNKASFDHLFEISFSGTPGITKPLRKAHDLQDEIYEKEKNCLTEKRLHFYFSYLKSLGISDIKETIYVVDISGTGTSLNSFIQILALFFAQEKKPLPEIVFIGLSLPKKSISPQTATGATFTYDHYNKTLSYKESKELNICKIELKAYALQTSFVTTDLFLDHTFYQTLSNKTIYFPAGLWHETAQQLLNNGDKYYQEEFKKLVKNLVQKRLPVLLKHFTQSKFHKEHETIYLDI